MTIEQKAIEVEATGKAINEVIRENEGWAVQSLTPSGNNIIILFQRVLPSPYSAVVTNLERQITDY